MTIDEKIDEKVVFRCIANCELSAYTTMYPPERVVVSTGVIAKLCLWSKYRTKKAINGLVEKGLIERASCGCPAVVSYGEYPELVCEARPPMNGYAITKQGFKNDEWKDIYDIWCQSMEERTEAKLFLNNLYGKMASSTDSSFKVAFMKPDESVGFDYVEQHEKTAGYIAVGSAITSYARNFTIRAAQKNYHGVDKSGFIYADTDSIYCDIPTDPFKGITVHEWANMPMIKEGEKRNEKQNS